MRVARSLSARLAVACLLSSVVVCAACSRGGERAGVLHGRVTVGGRPLVGGTVYAVGGVGVREFATNATVAADGDYEMPEVPVGVVRIAVLPPSGDPADALPLPPMFLDTRTSGLTVEVQPGRQAYDITIR